LAVDSEPGKGSKFVVRIPVRVLPADPMQLHAPNFDARALIVDDNAAHCVLLDELLSSWGLRTQATRSGLDALRLLDAAAKADPFGLVITDRHMPEMDGVSLALL